MVKDRGVNVIGAGLAGLSAAITLAKKGVSVRLISALPSERAQSVLAEGGINAALDTMGENDTIKDHFEDTMRGGRFLEREEDVKRLVEKAPSVVRRLSELGAPFQWKDGTFVLRSFGGQKKKRTAYAKSSTGKILMTALIDEARKYEASGLIERYPHHELIDFIIEDETLKAVIVRDAYSGETTAFYGETILCTGGMNGFFEGLTTGTVPNTGDAVARAFYKGVEMSDLEFIQYHPTTVSITGKRMLISEAARGEGGRLFVYKGENKYFFMEEKYPELGNLMPRDVVSREMYSIMEKEKLSPVYLDMTALDESVWKEKLSDMREEIFSYLGIDPAVTPVPVSPGIHFFMGGIKVDGKHETNIKNLFAAGECAAVYHGANRLGGNSMLGAIVGGETAALAAAERSVPCRKEKAVGTDESSRPSEREKLKNILVKTMGIYRNEKELADGLKELDTLEWKTETDRERAILAKAMILSALERKESRGAHQREDHPEEREEFKRKSVAYFDGKDVVVSFEKGEE